MYRVSGALYPALSSQWFPPTPWWLLCRVLLAGKIGLSHRFSLPHHYAIPCDKDHYGSLSKFQAQYPICLLLLLGLSCSYFCILSSFLITTEGGYSWITSSRLILLPFLLSSFCFSKFHSSLQSSIKISFPSKKPSFFLLARKTLLFLYIRDDSNLAILRLTAKSFHDHLCSKVRIQGHGWNEIKPNQEASWWLGE